MPHTRPAHEPSHRRAWLAGAVAFVAAMTLGVLAALVHADTLGRDRDARLDRLAERSFDEVERRLHACGQLVRSMQALFLSSDEVTVDEFQAMYDNLQPRAQFPSLQAIAFARRAAGPDGATVDYVTTLVAPLPGNRMLVGLNVASQPANFAAAQFSRDADREVMSAAFQLVQRAGLDGPNDGITLRLPVYASGAKPRDVAERRQREIGSLAVSFRVARLIEDSLPAETLENFALVVEDVTGDTPVPLYAHAPDAARGPGHFERELRYGTRVWRLRAQPLAAAAVGWAPWVTFAIGVLVSGLLASLAWSLAGTRERALALARRMSAQYVESEERFRVLNERLPALVLLADADTFEIVYTNHACRDRLGPIEGAGGDVLRRLVDDDSLPARIAALADDPAAVVNESVRLTPADKEPFWATLSLSRIDLGGRPHVLAVANDITELQVLSEELRWQSTHDLLTGLVNRREFERRLQGAIAALYDGAAPAALLYMDLDQFKLVNDTSGHLAGDQLLAQLATLLPGVLPRGAVLARLGGDEFAVLLPATPETEALALAERLRTEIDGYIFGWEQRNYTISASIGAVMLDGPGLSLRSLLAQADTACYMAKERGRNRVHVFSEADSETAQRRSEMEWAGKVREALVEGRFLLHFQELAPLWAADGDGVHMEMLIRLRDEQGNMVSPGAFIPAAERFGLMPQLDRWVVETTLANFNRLHPSGRPVALCAINLSGPTFEDSTFADFVLQCLEDHGVPPQRICFEITETAAVSSMSRAIEFMQRLRGAGCKFSLDDFGSGMASFGYLKNLPVDYLKIDGSFIRNIESDPVSYSIVRAVTDIGHQLGLKVVAEWVADDRARDILRGLTVDYAQGFAIHKPEAAACFRTPDA